MSENNSNSKTYVTKDPVRRRRAYMYDDMAQGMAKAKMRQKYDDGLYGEAADFDEDYKAVLSMYASDIETLSSDEKAKLYGRYLAVYRMAFEAGRLDDARKILDSMTKLTVASDKGVTLESGSGRITISFGLGGGAEQDD